MICCGWPPHLAWEAAPGLCVACEARGYVLVKSGCSLRRGSAEVRCRRRNERALRKQLAATSRSLVEDGSRVGNPAGEHFSRAPAGRARRAMEVIQL